MRGSVPQIGDAIAFRIPTYHRWTMPTEAWRAATVVGSGWDAVQLVVTLNPFEEAYRMRFIDDRHHERDEYIGMLRRYGTFEMPGFNQPMFLMVNGAREGTDVGNWRWP